MSAVPTASVEDDLGIELRDVAHVRAEAERGARDIMAEDLKAGRPVDHQMFEVCSADGKVVLTLPFRDVLKLPEP